MGHFIVIITRGRLQLLLVCIAGNAPVHWSIEPCGASLARHREGKGLSLPPVRKWSPGAQYLTQAVWTLSKREGFATKTELCRHCFCDCVCPWECCGDVPVCSFC